MKNELGKIAYEACPDHGHFKPKWESLEPKWRNYWIAIASAVSNACGDQILFGDIHEAPLPQELLKNICTSDIEALTRLHCGATLISS